MDAAEARLALHDRFALLTAADLRLIIEKAQAALNTTAPMTCRVCGGPWVAGRCSWYDGHSYGARVNDGWTGP